MYIAIDCGTTNMRCRLYGESPKPIDSTHRKTGVRNTAFDGTNTALKTNLRDCIRELLSKNDLRESDIEVIISSGTLASDVGIYPVPHVLCPAGIAESAAGARMTVMEEISTIPILFIPGVKTLPSESETDEMQKILQWDSMSGEECEIYGILKLMGLSGELVITLPGSYDKTLEIDSNGRIVSMRTGMCGEFIAAMSEHPLLRHSLPQPVIRKILPQKLIQGFEFAKQYGVSPAMIKARLVRFLGEWEADEAANFFVGAVLLDDVRMTVPLCADGRPLVLGGSEPLKTVFGILLRHCGVKNMIDVPLEMATISSNMGARLVYEEFLKNKEKEETENN